MLEELRLKAQEKLESVKNDQNSTEEDIIKAKYIIEFLSKEIGLKQSPKSLIKATFIYLGYPVSIKLYNEMYDQLMEELNRVYIYVDPETFSRGK